jgi:hypothetical protein
VTGFDTPVDESVFTPFARPGWTAWNSYSPEVEFCQFVGLLARMLAPKVIVETGVGAGRVTDELDLAGGVTWLGFEADAQWRPVAACREQTPSNRQLAAADLVILDSEPEFRFDEIQGWGKSGKAGSVCVIHDAGNGHPPEYETHHKVRAAIRELRFPGVFLRNPRGAWLGIHP